MDGWEQEPDEVKLEVNHLQCLKSPIRTNISEQIHRKMVVFFILSVLK